MEKQCPNCGSMLDDKMSFYISQLTSGHFLFFFAITVILHGIWN